MATDDLETQGAKTSAAILSPGILPPQHRCTIPNTYIPVASVYKNALWTYSLTKAAAPIAG